MENFKAINDHVEATFVEVQDAASLNVTSAQAKLCGIYKVVRPIIIALSKLPIIPKKWRSALSSFISVMDVICP